MYNPNTKQYEPGWRPDNNQDSTIGGLWEDTVNPHTGEHSLKSHSLRPVWESCKPGDCYFEITDSPKREATCVKCGIIKHFIVGFDKLIDGKFVSVLPK